MCACILEPPSSAQSTKTNLIKPYTMAAVVSCQNAVLRPVRENDVSLSLSDTHTQTHTRGGGPTRARGLHVKQKAPMLAQLPELIASFTPPFIFSFTL